MTSLNREFVDDHQSHPVQSYFRGSFRECPMFQYGSLLCSDTLSAICNSTTHSTTGLWGLWRGSLQEELVLVHHNHKESQPWLWWGHLWRSPANLPGARRRLSRHAIIHCSKIFDCYQYHMTSNHISLVVMTQIYHQSRSNFPINLSCSAELTLEMLWRF